MAQHESIAVGSDVHFLKAPVRFYPYGCSHYELRRNQYSLWRNLHNAPQSDWGGPLFKNTRQVLSIGVFFTSVKTATNPPGLFSFVFFRSECNFFPGKSIYYNVRRFTEQSVIVEMGIPDVNQKGFY